MQGMSNSDDDLLRQSSLEEEGIPDLEEQPVGKVLSGDTGEGVVPPRDYPVAADDFGTTAREESLGESFADRTGRQEPDVDVDDDLEEEDPVAGRLVQPDLGALDYDETAEEVGDTTGDLAGLSAEEAAMRVEEDPGGLGGGWPGYLGED